MIQLQNFSLTRPYSQLPLSKTIFLSQMTLILFIRTIYLMSPSIYRPRRPRASPLWQIVHHAWDDFLAGYETRHRRIHGPLSPDSIDVVDQFYRCGDLAAGFTRLQCPDCSHEKLLAFTCKTRHFCPSCHQRRVRSVGDWIAHTVCFDVPHRQFVFTMPRPLRGIFRKRRKLLFHLFHVAIGSLRDWMRARLDLPNGQLAAIAAAQTFGDYLVFHPHLHVLAATGLVDSENRFHLLPVESVEPLAELFRHRFLATLLQEKLISEKKARQLLGWKHSGFSVDAGESPVASRDVEGRRGTSATGRVSAPRTVLSRKDHLDRRHRQRRLPIQTKLAHQAQLRKSSPPPTSSPPPSVISCPRISRPCATTASIQTSDGAWTPKRENRAPESA